MELGMAGLGRMGANLVRRASRAGHHCVVFDVSPEASGALDASGRHRWLIVGRSRGGNVVTAARVGDGARRGYHRQDGQRSRRASRLGDVIIDGGNSHYRDDIAQAEAVRAKGSTTSTATAKSSRPKVLGRHERRGLEPGYCLMIGGEDEVVERLKPIFEAIASGMAAAERTPGRTGEQSQAELGYLHCGPNGAGRFVKMVHNGIECAAMAAYAEGLNILKNANAGAAAQKSGAETAPMENAQFYRYDLDLASITAVWRRGNVISWWLLDLTAQAFVQAPDLSGFSGRVSDLCEGRWTSIAAVEEGVPAPVITTALSSRFDSRDLDCFANQVLSAIRKGFGGHDERPA